MFGACTSTPGATLPSVQSRQVTDGRIEVLGGRASLHLPTGYTFSPQPDLDTAVLESSLEPSESNSCPACISLAFFEAPSPEEARCSCSGTGVNPHLSGSVCNLEARIHGASGYAGIGDLAEACLSNGSTSIVVTMEPPGSTGDSAFRLVVRSLRLRVP